jgi:hypothetical protein
VQGKLKWPYLLHSGPRLRELSGGNGMTCGNLCSLAPGTRGLGIFSSYPVTSSAAINLVVSQVPLGALRKDSYLVDSASSHMLVSKIKPCMSKYKQLYRETANGSLYQSKYT